MDATEAQYAEFDLTRSFRKGPVYEAVKTKVLERWKSAEPKDLDALFSNLMRVSPYLEAIYHAEGYVRSGEMSRWFELASMPLDELLRRIEVRFQPHPPLSEEEELELEREERERDRIEAMERDGFFGRTVEFDTASDNWIYLRFGQVPLTNKSACGLVLGDTEDTVDGWREALGNMTYEAGICVFRLQAHPGVPGSYILMDPHYDLARYDVGGQINHLLAIIPHADALDDIHAYKLSGSLVTTKALDGSLRCDLGSDGEYLLNGNKPMVVESISLQDIWVSETSTIADFLREHRSFELGCSAPRI